MQVRKKGRPKVENPKQVYSMRTDAQIFKFLKTIDEPSKFINDTIRESARFKDFCKNDLEPSQKLAKAIKEPNIKMGQFDDFVSDLRQEIAKESSNAEARN